MFKIYDKKIKAYYKRDLFNYKRFLIKREILINFKIIIKTLL